MLRVYAPGPCAKCGGPIVTLEPDPDNAAAVHFGGTLVTCLRCHNETPDSVKHKGWRVVAR